MKIDDVCVLITGCISPPANVSKVSLVDEAERRKQYIKSIEYYLVNTKFKKIVFCDNSLAIIDKDLEILAKNHSKEFEWISFSGDADRVRLQGKGYGEGEIIQYALNHSRILSECKCFVKVTGRLMVKNINWFLGLNNRRSYFDIHSCLIDTRCYVANISQYKEYFFNIHKRVNDEKKYYLEHAFFDCYATKANDVKIIPFELNIIGQSGSMGTEYEDLKGRVYFRSIRKLLKSLLKGAK